MLARVSWNLCAMCLVLDADAAEERERKAVIEDG